MDATASPQRYGAAGDPGYARVAALLVGVGAFGVIVTSAFYVLAGPAAALPGGAPSMEAARAATAHAAGAMRLASLAGMPSDVLLTVGGLMFAAMKRGNGAALAIAGWLAMAVSGVLFTLVDAMVGHVLPPLAAIAGGEAAYAGARALFDVLFAIGGWSFGIGALAAAWHSGAPEYRRRSVPWLMRASGVISIAANTAWLLGLPGARLIGPGIGLGAIALLALSIAVASSSRRLDEATHTVTIGA